MLKKVIVVQNGKPCSHKGCLNHITHPCEGCGRINGNHKQIADLQAGNSHMLTLMPCPLDKQS